MAGSLRINRNEIIKLITEAWLAAPGIVGIVGPYPDVVISATGDDDFPKNNPAKKPWMRLRIQHTVARGTSIGNKTYRNDGTITCNIFILLERSNAWHKNELLGESIQNAIRNHRGGNVYFKDVTLRERPVNNGFNQVDVTAGFWWTTKLTAGA